MRFGPFSLSLYVMWLFGAIDMSRGVLASSMQSDWALTYAQLGVVFSASAAGYAAGSAVGGFLLDKMGIKRLSFAGVTLMVLGLLTLTIVRTQVTLAVCYLVLGLGTGWLEVGANSVVPFTTQLPEQQAGRFNALHGLYGVGAFVFPPVVGWLLLQTHQWRVTNFVIVALLVLLWFGIARAAYPTGLASAVPLVEPGLHAGTAVTTNPSDPSSEVDEAVPLPLGTFRSVFARVDFYQLLLAITTYVMAEIGFDTWLPTYLVEQRHTTVMNASILLSGFFVTFTVGRLVAPLWIRRIGHLLTIWVSVLLSMATLLIGTFLNGSWLWAYIVAGLGFSVIFPTIVAVASTEFPRHTGRVLGLLFAAGGLGGFATNALIGWINSTMGLTAGMTAVIIFMALTGLSLLPIPVRWGKTPLRTNSSATQDLSL